MGPDAIILVFWMLNFKLPFSLSSFTFIKRFFYSSSLSAIRVVSSAYLCCWYFSWQSWFQACVSSSAEFHMKYSACKLNKQGDNIQSYTYSFLNLETICCFMSHSNYCLLTCIHVSQEAGNVVWYYYLFKNFLQSVVIHTVKNFRKLDEVDFFFSGILLLFCMIQWMLVIWSLVPLPLLKSTWYIWKFLVHILLKPILKDFEHYIASMWNECSCVLEWTFFSISLLWNWNENWPFPVLWPNAEFSKFASILSATL